jgi:hypothetical protein
MGFGLKIEGTIPIAYSFMVWGIMLNLSSILTIDFYLGGSPLSSNPFWILKEHYYGVCLIIILSDVSSL